ncbi:MAG: hypothetical protein P8Y48_15500 [Novosphingobium sp.]
MQATPLLGAHNLFETPDMDQARQEVGRIFCSHKLLPGSAIGGGKVRFNHAPVRALSVNWVDYGRDVQIDPVQFENFYLLQIVRDGSARITSNARQFEVRSGQACLINPCDDLSMEWSQHCSKLIVRIDRLALERFAEQWFDCYLPGRLDFENEIGWDRPGMAAARGLIELIVQDFENGEYFWVPFTHKTAGATWCLLWEAKAGKEFDKFGDCKSGADIVKISKDLIREHALWEWDKVKDMEYVSDDDNAWLIGRFPPTVREAFGRLPSGALIMPAIAFDPIGGQGGNNAQRMAKFVADRITANEGKPYDEEWMTEVNDDWWYVHGKWAYEFNNLLLEPLEPAAAMLLEESAKNRLFADQKFFSNFPRPHGFFPAIKDPAAAQQVIDQARVRA